jgi:putative membrane protein
MADSLVTANEGAVWRAKFNPLIRPYLVLYGAFILVMTLVGIPLAVIWLLGVGQWWARHYFDKLECELGDTHLRFRKGILFQVEKTIPLENIQDVTFIEGPLLRYFHLSVLKFETAGQSMGQSHDMRLIGLIDAHDYRNAILQRREALRQRQHASAAPTASTSSDEQTALLRAIHARIEEIAGLLRAGR